MGLLAHFGSIKSYLEINEKPGSIYGNRFTELKIVKNLTKNLTNFSFLFIDGFVVISENLEKFVAHYKSKNARIIKIPIIIDIAVIYKDIKQPNIKMPYLLHAGALSDRKDGITEVFEAFVLANKMLNNKLHFYLTSKIAPQSILRNIENITLQNNLSNNIHFLGNIAEDELLSLQRHTSMVIINKHNNEQNLYNFPTKLAEYLIFGIPVITTGIGEIGNFLFNDDNAIFFNENNVDSLSKKIIQIIQNPIIGNRIGKSGFLTAKTYFDYKIS